LLCYRCGSHVPDDNASCATCGLKLTGNAAGGGPRRRGASVEAPYKPGDLFAKRYAIREVLGPGPLGHVFRALDQEMDVEVALKVINPRLVQMPEERTQFSLALRAGKKLTHPHHVRVYEEGEDRNRPYFTTQLLEGMTLRRMMEQRTAQGQRFTPREVEPALVSAHKYGPHSDLKPENIIVLPDMLKVTDYGLALGIPRLPFLQAQKAWRSACYVAPEYAEGGELDIRMDLYSLGVIVGELLTGQTPDEGEVPELLAYDPELPPGLEALYRRTTNANPLARPKSASEFLVEFTSALARPRPPSAKHPSVGAPAPVPPRARPKPVPFSLTAELATAGSLSKDLLPPPVPTSELPALGAPTIQVPVVGGGPTAEIPKAAVLETSKATTTLEAPIVGAPTLQEVPSFMAGPTERLSSARIEERLAQTKEAGTPVDATQPLDAETLAAIMGTANKSAAPAPKPRPAPAPAPAARAAEPRPAPPPPGRAAPRTAPIPVPASRSISKVKMVLLALAGLALGAAGGYGLLKMRAQAGNGSPAAQGAKR
jgi:eukaryotic-like serine/threonine-protein kinase